MYLYICVCVCVWLKANVASGPVRSEDKERTIKYHGSFTLDEVSEPSTLDIRIPYLTTFMHVHHHDSLR